MKISILQLLLIGVLLSLGCEKSDVNFKDKYDKEEHWECFELLYPISYLMPDGTTVSGNKEELGVAFKAWYEANPASKEKPVLLYPVDIKYEEGTIMTVADEPAMIAVKQECEANSEG